MNGRGKRAKGAAGERELCQILSDALGLDVKRNLGQARDGEDDITLPPFRIEVKRQETLKIEPWCLQVEAAAKVGEIPVVAFRRNGKPWRVVLRMEDFIKLAREEMVDKRE
jgi:hypothetical protein